MATPSPAPTTSRVSFLSRLRDHGSRIAVVTDDVRLTYDDLADRVDDVADRLGTARRLVLVRTGNDIGSLLGYLGALRGGHAVALVDAANAAHGAGLTASYDPDAVVTSTGTDCDVTERRAASAHELHPDLALLLSTSGSTGSPKLVRLSHRNLTANAEAIAAYLELTPDDRAATSLPMHYCYGLSVVNSHLAAGAGLLLTDRSVVDRCFWDAFTHHGATNFAGVPYTFELLDRIGFASMELPTLRHVTQAGGRLSPERVVAFATLGQRRGWRFFVMYGQTEATARMAYLPPELARSHPDCIGVPVPGGAFDIVPIDGCATDEGELVYRGPNVMLGYATERGDLAVGATLDALRTGDLAQRTPDGLYRVIGRRSRFAKLFGLRVDLDHLEQVLRDAGVEAACTSHHERVVVALEATRPEAEDLARATIGTRMGLPPAAVAVVAGPVPRLPNGKPDYQALGRHAEAQSPAPRHHDVAALYAAVLRCGRVGDDDTFVGLGGDSLSYVELSVALEEMLGDLPSQWPTMPVRELAATPRRAGAARMEANVVLRAVAIVLVVATHAHLVAVPGGAHALLAVAGFNFARFQLVSGRMLRSVARVAVPSMIWIGLMAAARDDFALAHALLVNGLFGEPTARWGYWYVEALVQILLPLAALFSVPRVRQTERRHATPFAVAVLGVALLVRFDLLGLPHVDHHTARPHEVLWLFAVGWVAALATSTQHRVAVSVVATAAVPGFFGQAAHDAVVLAGILLLVWVPSVRVARPLNRVVGSVAAASLYIYLTHWAVYPPLRDRFSPAVATVGAVMVGLVAAAGVRRVGAAGASLRAAVLGVLRSGDGARRAVEDGDDGGRGPGHASAPRRAAVGPRRSLRLRPHRAGMA